MHFDWVLYVFGGLQSLIRFPHSKYIVVMKVPKHRPIATVLIVFVLFLGVARPIEAAGFGRMHPLSWIGGVVYSLEGFFGHLFSPTVQHRPLPPRTSGVRSQVTAPIPSNDVVHAPPPHTPDPAPTTTILFNPFADLQLISKYGDLYPADGIAPALGTTTHPYSQLNLTKASIDSSGNTTLAGGLTVGGLRNGFLHADTTGKLSTVQIDLGKDITSTLGVGNGGTGQPTLTPFGVLYGNGTAGISALTPGTTGYVLQSNGTNSAPSWIPTSALSPGSVAFSNITAATNTTASLLVGTGASLDVTGSGTINASSLLGSTWAAPGVIGSTTPNVATFSTLTANGNEIIGGTTGITMTGTGAGISFSGAGNHPISASSGTLQLGAVTLTGAITGNAQTITGLGTVSLTTGNSYQINGASVLNATTLGSGVVTSSLTSLGTITAGIWNGTPIGAGYGGTGATTFPSNGVLYGNGTGALQATAAGTNGQLLLGVTAGAPAFATLSGDATITNSGVLSLKNTGPGAGSLGTTAAQTPVVTLDAQGRVTGVTNTSIAIAASQITLGTLGIARGGTNNTAYTTGSVVYYDGSKVAEDNSNFFWDGTNHRLGIGTTGPGQRLSVVSSASTGLITVAGNTGNIGDLSGIEFNYNSGVGGNTANVARILGNVESGGGGDLLFQTAPSAAGAYATKMTLLQGGNVGIGTTNPQGKLHIKDGGYRQGMVLERAGTSTLRGYEYIGDGTNSTNADEIYLDAVNSAFHFRTGLLGTTETLTITGGNIGIGTTAPGAKLDVNGTANVSNTFTQSGGYAYLGNYNSALTYPRVGLDLATAWNFSNGSREITFWNTDTCAGCGNAFSFRHLTGASSQTTLMDIFPSGNVTIGGTLTQNSDQRLKTNIQSLPDGDALAALNQLHPVSFTWRQANQSTATQFGFIAQEVEKVFPELVVTSGGPPTTIILPDGTQETYHDLKTVNYIGLVSPLVKAVQQLDGILTLQGQHVLSLAANLTAVADTQHAQAAAATVSEQTVASLQSLADRLTALEKQVPMQASPISASLSAALTGVSLSLDKDATISGSLIVQGRTTLNDLGVTGNITAGVLSIHGLDGTIDAIGNSLKLQSLGTGSIDLLAGKVTIDASGNVVAKGEITVKKITIDEGDPASASSGNGILKSGSTAVTIKTMAVHARSHLFVTPRVKTNRVLGVSSESDGISFTVEVVDAPAADIPFDWWIVN